MRTALAQARQVFGACGDASLWALTDADLVAVVDDLFAVQQQVTALLLAVVRELDGRGVPRSQGAASMPVWLRGRLRMSIGAARRLVELAAAVESGPPVVRQALAAGAVNAEQVAVIAAAVAALPAEVGGVVTDKAAAAMVGFAAEHEPWMLRKLGERILDTVAPEVAEEYERIALERAQARAQRDRFFTLSPTQDGSVRLSGRLGAEAAAVVRAALDPLCRPGPDDRRMPGQRRADALVEICQLALNTESLPEHGGDRPQVVVTVPYDVLAGRLGMGLLDTGERITAEAARRMACDAHILPAVLDGVGQPLDVGRERRLISGSLRRALVLRDGGCAFPGCDVPSKWCQGHHVVHWADGGGTSLANAVLACGFHHRVIHQGDWAVRIAADGRPEFTPPAWIDAQQRPRRNLYHRRQ